MALQLIMIFYAENCYVLIHICENIQQTNKRKLQLRVMASKTLNFLLYFNALNVLFIQTTTNGGILYTNNRNSIVYVHVDVDVAGFSRSMRISAMYNWLLWVSWIKEDVPTFIRFGILPSKVKVPIFYWYYSQFRFYCFRAAYIYGKCERITKYLNYIIRYSNICSLIGRVSYYGGTKCIH